MARFNQVPGYDITKLPGSLPKAQIKPDTDHAAIAQAVVQKLGSLTANDFASDAFWRDLWTLTNTVRTIFGAQRIGSAWKKTCELHEPVDFELVPSGSRIAANMPGVAWIEAVFSFKMARGPEATCSGVLRILPDADGEWKIWCMTTILETIEGFPNVDVFQPPKAINGYLKHQDATYGNTPIFDAVVVGAGTAGLGVAARLRALGVKTLIIEKNSRVGQNWTDRYESLHLHTPKEYSQLPLASIWGPEHPYYLPTKDVAKGMNDYVERFGLNVWTSSTVEKASFNGADKTWTLNVSQQGQETTIHTRHIVFAIGNSGIFPKQPNLPKRELYKGTAIHSVKYTSADAWKGKRGIVVGSANSAHDISEDMVNAGLSSVTMIQRSPVPVMPVEYFSTAFDALYNDKVPIEKADRTFFSSPTSISRLSIMNMFKVLMANDMERFDALERAGFRVDRNPDLVRNFIERLGGHYIDTGTSKKVADGTIKVKSGIDVTSFTETGLEFADGERLDADVIVFATGFEPNYNIATKKIFGPELSDQLQEYWGVDAEGEIRGAWKPVGRKYPL